MYQAEDAPYCYPGTDVLKNKAGFTDAAALEAFETAMTFARSEETLPPGRLTITHYYSIHRHLFQDVYEWAGKPRTVRLTKGSSAFCYPEHIKREMQRLLQWLKQQRNLRDRSAEQFSRGAAHFLSELNAIHPFREGNGRTQLTFLLVLAAQAEHPLDMDRLEPDAMLDAMIRSFNGDDRPLAIIIQRLIET